MDLNLFVLIVLLILLGVALGFVVGGITKCGQGGVRMLDHPKSGGV